MKQLCNVAQYRGLVDLDDLGKRAIRIRFVELGHWLQQDMNYAVAQTLNWRTSGPDGTLWHRLSARFVLGTVQQLRNETLVALNIFTGVG